MDGPPPSSGSSLNPYPEEGCHEEDCQEEGAREEGSRETSCSDLRSAREEGFRAQRAGEPVLRKHRESPSAISNAWLNGYTAAELSGRPSAEQALSEAGGPASGLCAAEGALAESSLEVSVTDTAAAEALPEALPEALAEGESLLDTLTPVEQEGARYGYRQAGRPFGPTRRGLEIWLRLRARAKAG
jgi:hypothetical protein